MAIAALLISILAMFLVITDAIYVSRLIVMLKRTYDDELIKASNESYRQGYADGQDGHYQREPL